jgi:lipopolysaccharide transport system permease protein
MVAFVDFLISLAILATLMVWYQFMPGWQILLLPAFVLVAFIASFGIGVWITALNVKYRDFRYVVPFIVQLGLYVSPVGFSSNIIPEQWRLAYSLNPMVGVIDGFRWCILGGERVSSIGSVSGSVSSSLIFSCGWVSVSLGKWKKVLPI